MAVPGAAGIIPTRTDSLSFYPSSIAGGGGGTIPTRTDGLSFYPSSIAGPGGGAGPCIIPTRLIHVLYGSIAIKYIWTLCTVHKITVYSRVCIFF